MNMKTTRTVLVTGASRGIGEAISARLVAQGCHVIGIARQFATTSIADARFVPLQLDLADTAALPARLQELARRHAEVDALVLCAGRGQFGSLEEFSYQQIRDLMDLNFLSQAWLARAFLPAMKRRGHGDLVFIGSEASLRGGRRGAVYSASKFALRGLAESLRDECARSGVRVTLINPGMVKTDFFTDQPFVHGDDESNFILPGDVADAVSLALDSRSGTVFEEINLSPLKRSLKFTTRTEKD